MVGRGPANLTARPRHNPGRNRVGVELAHRGCGGKLPLDQLVKSFPGRLLVLLEPVPPSVGICLLDVLRPL